MAYLKPNSSNVNFNFSVCLFWCIPFSSSVMSPYFPLPRGRYVNLMTLAKCVWSGYCIDYTVTPPNTQAQRPRDLERTAIHLHAGYGSTPLQLGSRENHAGEKLLCLPQGSTPEVCACVFTSYCQKILVWVTVWLWWQWKLCSLIHENYSWGSWKLLSSIMLLCVDLIKMRPR